MDYRNYALELVDEGLVSARDLAMMAVKYMSQTDVEDMLVSNELVEGDDDEPDVDYLTELYDAFGEDC